MSLTSVIKHKNHQELRDKLKTEFLRPNFSLKSEIKAPPLSSSVSTVGSAFDYLMRFVLEHLNKSLVQQNGIWVADMAIKKLKLQIQSSESNEIIAGFHRDMVYDARDLTNSLDSQYAKAKSNYEKYVSDGILTDELISSTIFLAKLDNYFRSSVIDSSFYLHAQEDIDDLKAMVALIDKSKFEAKHHCFLNPTFGKGSTLVGGADADLIIDDTLIDVKVTRNLKLEREYLNQILGYYVLSLIGGVNNNPAVKPVERVGIYFARHGELWTIPVDELGDRNQFESFKDWFIDYVSTIDVNVK
jgi:hypothetical protein